MRFCYPHNTLSTHHFWSSSALCGARSQGTLEPYPVCIGCIRCVGIIVSLLLAQSETEHRPSILMNSETTYLAIRSYQIKKMRIDLPGHALLAHTKTYFHHVMQCLYRMDLQCSCLAPKRECFFQIPRIFLPKKIPNIWL